MNNKNCIIIHGCPSKTEVKISPKTRTYDKHWIPWLKEHLIKNDIPTETPLMPTPWEPDYDKFKTEFEKQHVDKNTILVGHSCGCAFLVNWLGNTQTKIHKLILVAPWKINTKNNNPVQDSFYNFSINKDINDNITEIVVFTSDDEEDAGKQSLKIYQEILKAKTIELEKHGHFTLGDMKKEEFPELLEEILK